MDNLKCVFLKESLGKAPYEIRFVGSYEDIKAMGFRFKKMYAREYKTYIKDNVYIFREGHGGDVEISDWYSESFLVLQTLIDNNFQLGKFNQVMLDNDTMTMTADYKEIVNAELEPMILLSKNEISEEELRERWKEYYRRYKKSSLHDETIRTLKELYSKGMIEIQSKVK